MDNIAVIQSNRYVTTVDALMDDPIVVQLAAEVPADFDTTSWPFVTGALSEYRRRGGAIDGHIGGVAAAITALRA